MSGEARIARKMDVGMPQADNPLAFLIVGAGRGGTSLLAGLLDSHPQLAVGFERHAVPILMGKRLLDFGRGKKLIHKRAQAFRQAGLADAARHAGKIWGNKITTEQIFGLEDHNAANSAAPVDVLDYFFQTSMAGVKVVFILRDGRSCVRSKMNRTGQSLETACERWRYSVRVYRYLREHHGEHVCIRFEDLLAEPEATLGQICQLLGVEFSSSMLEGTESDKMLPEYRRNGLDPTAASLGNVPDGCVELIRDDLCRCGYLE